MARSVRDARLDRREARLKLKRGVRHYREVGDGLALCYRRTTAGYGKWSVRLRDEDGKYALRPLAAADDHEDANGVDVLSYFQAQDQARKAADRWRTESGKIAPPLTVAQAAENYRNWFRQHRKSVQATESAINGHILPALGEELVGAITPSRIRSWMTDLIFAPARLRTARHAVQRNVRPAQTEDQKRARKATANRVLAVLRAILNKAFHDGLVADDISWRQVKAFPRVNEARIRFLTDAESLRLVNACPPDLRALVRGALQSGCRYGELVALRVRDVNLDTGTVYIAESKSGRPRHVPLNDEGRALFAGLIAGKPAEALVFTKSNGSAWGRNHAVKPLARACKAAKLEPLTFHELRHSFASALAMRGVDLLTISKLLGHRDQRTTSLHYAHLSDASLRRAVAQLPSLGPVESSNVHAIRP
jgi:integrase